MKNYLFILVIAIFMMASGQTFGQDDSKTDKAVRFFVGYTVVTGAATHSGPTVMVSLPGVLGKVRLFVFGKSIAWGTYQERGGGVEYSYLLNDPTSNPRSRVSGGITYSAKNEIAEMQLPEKLFSIYAGASLLYDLSKNFSLEMTAAPAWTSVVNLPQYTLLKPNKSTLGFVGRVTIKIGL